MKYMVMLDRGVDVGGVHYAHGAVVDSDTAVPPVPPDAEEPEKYAAFAKKRTAEELDALAASGEIEPTKEPTPAAKEAAKKGAK